jgi:short subunit dehydrogenase-like uncharacterized protein
MKDGWLLYGANGFTGRLIAAEAVRRGLRPVLAGRDREAISVMAASLGLEHRVFALTDDVEAQVVGYAAVLHAAGPFSSTSARMVEACLRTRTHYLDLNGDIAVFEQIFARAAEAEQQGCVLLPGVGFDVVPTDCVAAALKRALPDAERLELAWGGDLAPSAGTSKASLEIIPRGGAVREGGQVRVVPTAWRTLDVPFPDGPARAVTVPWGDVATAYRSTRIPNIAVYAAMPRRMIVTFKMLRPLFPVLRVGFVRRALGRIIEWTVRGPSERALATGRTFIWGRATNAAGEVWTATASGPDGYRLSALAAVEAMERTLAGRIAPGAHTPATALGAGFLATLPDCAMQDPARASST